MGTRMWFFVLMLTGFAGIAFSGCTGTLNLTQAVPKQNDPIQTVPNEWIWVSGSDVTNQVGSYGTLGTAAPSNVPGARSNAATWTDSAGNLWLFGGLGNDFPSASLDHNDLWEYSGGEWTWMGGSDLLVPFGQGGSYGVQGVAAPGNLPGARDSAVTWTDAAGNLWLFGGENVYWGIDHALVGWQAYNDLWKYSGGEWTWMGGSNVSDQPGVYGTQGTAAPGNVPGARYGAVSWTDASGNFWLFGGNGFDSTGTDGTLNDLWKFNGGEWTWMGGSNLTNQPGVYGTQGTAAPGNVPGARSGAVGWIDKSGNLWLFGGFSYLAGDLNDLWKYSGGQWTWVSGSNQAVQPGVYGTQGTAEPGNVPGARGNAVGWTDASGNFWLFGGEGLDSSGTYGFLNDLWRYSAGQWTWEDGSNLANQPGVYGTQGMAAPGNTPGARPGAVGWTDASGNLWLFGGGQIYMYNDLWVYQP